MLRVPFRWLYPAILVFLCLGVYSVRGLTFDIMAVAAIGLAGYLLALASFSPTLLLLGFVLGPLMEEHFRRAMLISAGDFGFFFERPISAVVMSLTALLLAHSLYRTVRTRMKPKIDAAE